MSKNAAECRLTSHSKDLAFSDNLLGMLSAECE